MASKKDGMDETNPDHYKKGDIETIDYIKAVLTKEQYEGYCLGNIIKYVSRYKEKHPEAPQTDLKKTRWYLNDLIEEYKNDQ